MSGCSEIRDLMGPVLDDDAGAAEVERVHGHVATCSDCAELFEAMRMIVAAGDFLKDVEPPRHLGAELAASPCRRWLGLLYQAVDREISQANLERLMTHLESCPSCRQAWHDLALIHQVGEAMVPPRHLLDACVAVRNAVARIPILGRRTATAAAYVLALVTSLAIGNPTIIAQDFQEVAAGRVSRAASGVTEVAAEGRGEIRVLLWRTMKWGEEKIENIRGWVDRLRDDPADDADGGEAAAPAAERTPQGAS